MKIIDRTIVIQVKTSTAILLALMLASLGCYWYQSFGFMRDGVAALLTLTREIHFSIADTTSKTASAVKDSTK